MIIKRANSEEFDKRIKYYKKKSLSQLQSIISKWAYANDSDKMLDMALHPTREEYLIFLVDKKTN